MRKSIFGCQARSASAATEDGKKHEIFNIESRAIRLSRQEKKFYVELTKDHILLNM